MFYTSAACELPTREVVALVTVGIVVVGVLLATAAVKRSLRRWS